MMIQGECESRRFALSGAVGSDAPNFMDLSLVLQRSLHRKLPTAVRHCARSQAVVMPACMLVRNVLASGRGWPARRLVCNVLAQGENGQEPGRSPKRVLCQWPHCCCRRRCPTWRHIGRLCLEHGSAVFAWIWLFCLCLSMALLRLLEHGSAASGRPCIGRPEPPAPWPPWIVCALDAFTGPLPGRARSSWTLGHRLRTAPVTGVP
mmetsp:Transcript_19264/g.57219  ORF Transcript_19264/g.57219 Transcript_19264/m.57219 type:complete len:206 (-) Transcript_19264:253-870(-)